MAAALVGGSNNVQTNFNAGQVSGQNAVDNNLLTTRALKDALDRIEKCTSGCEVLKKSLQRDTQQGGEQLTVGNNLVDKCKANPQACLGGVQDMAAALTELQKPETRALLGDAGTNALIQRQTSDLGKAVEALQWGADHLESSQAIARAAVGVGLTAAGGGLALSLGRAVMAACGSGVSSPACVGLTTELAVGAMETAGGVPTVGLTAASITATANQLAKTAATATDAAQVVKEVQLVRAEVVAGRSGANGGTAAEVVLPGMNRPVRSINADFPPNQAVVDAANSPQMQAWVKNTGCIDCSEIAPKLLQAAGGKGQILEVQPTTRGNLNVFENGRMAPGQSYHQVYTDGKYVYDPRLSSQPIPKGDWEQHIRNINPGGVIISTDLKGLQ